MSTSKSCDGRLELPLSERLLTMKLSVAAALGVGILTLGVAIGKRMR